MLFRSMRHFAAAALISAGLTVPAFAETPADTLVIADQIDDIVSLDPAESFEFSGQDALLNVYDRLIRILPANNFALEPGLAESWSVSDDGKTYHLQDEGGAEVPQRQPDHRGRRRLVAAARREARQDAVLHPDPVRLHAGKRRSDDQGDRRRTEFTITTDKAYAQSFFYNILTAIVASVVDKKVAMEHEANGDMGYEWLKTNSAGSGPYMLRSWKAADSIVLERGRRLLGRRRRLEARVRPPRARSRRRAGSQLEQGDVDIARRLPPNDAAGDRRQSRAAALRGAARPHLLSRRQSEV